MIIDCISDLHGFYPKLEGGDLLIIAGDLTARDTDDEYKKLFDWMYGYLKYKKIIFISGNHDNVIQDYSNFFKRSNANLINESLDKTYIKKIEYLCDSGTEFEGLRIWGSPWTKTFEGMNPNCKAFTCDTEEELSVKFSLIPENTDILITHSPPYLIGDLVDSYRAYPEHVGSKALANKIKHSNIKLNVFGHIHSGYGETRLQRDKDDHEFIFVNASHVNEKYQPVNKPIRVIL
jgi:Icc-related predicted phosphoesterase